MRTVAPEERNFQWKHNICGRTDRRKMVGLFGSGKVAPLLLKHKVQE